MQDFIRMAEKECMPKMDQIPPFGVGDIVNVHLKITENNKTRIQQFQGVVLDISGRKDHVRSIKVRNTSSSSSVNVELIILVPSPNVKRIDVLRKADVRRANLSYIRKLKGSKTKIKYKIS